MTTYLGAVIKTSDSVKLKVRYCVGVTLHAAWLNGNVFVYKLMIRIRIITFTDHFVMKSIAADLKRQGHFAMSKLLVLC